MDRALRNVFNVPDNPLPTLHSAYCAHELPVPSTPSVAATLSIHTLKRTRAHLSRIHLVCMHLHAALSAIASAPI